MLVTTANATDCAGLGHRTDHRITPATPPAKASPRHRHRKGVARTARPQQEATRHSESDAEIAAIMRRVARPMPRAWM